MIFLSYIIATAVPVITGYNLLFSFKGTAILSRPLLERVSLCYLIGLVTICAEMGLFPYLNVPITLLNILLLQLFTCLIPVIRHLTQKKRTTLIVSGNIREHMPDQWWQWILIVLILSKITYVFLMDSCGVLRSDDAFTVLLPLAKHTCYAHTWTDYPLIQPILPALVISWFGMVLGKWNEYGLNLAYFNYYLVFLSLFYANLYQKTGKTIALVSTYILSAFPLLLNHSVMAGYADLPMALFICFTGVYAYRYADKGKKEDLLLAIFFLLCLPAIKIEGKIPHFVFGALAIIGAISLNKGVKPLVIWGMIGSFLTSVFGGLFFLVAHYGKTSPPFLPYSLWHKIYPENHLTDALPLLLRHFGYHHNNWMLVGTLLPVLILILAIFFYRKKEMILSYYSLLHLGSFLYLFCFAYAYKYLLIGTTVNRSYLQIIPILLFSTMVMGHKLVLTSNTDRPEHSIGEDNKPSAD